MWWLKKILVPNGMQCKSTRLLIGRACATNFCENCRKITSERKWAKKSSTEGKDNGPLRYQSSDVFFLCWPLFFESIIMVPYKFLQVLRIVLVFYIRHCCTMSRIKKPKFSFCILVYFCDHFLKNLSLGNWLSFVVRFGGGRRWRRVVIRNSRYLHPNINFFFRFGDWLPISWCIHFPESMLDPVSSST